MSCKCHATRHSVYIFRNQKYSSLYLAKDRISVADCMCMHSMHKQNNSSPQPLPRSYFADTRVPHSRFVLPCTKFQYGGRFP